MKRTTLTALLWILSAVLIALVAVALLGRPKEPDVPETTTAAATTQTTAAPTTEPETAPVEATVETTVAYVPQISPDTVGLYIPAADGTRARVLVTEFTAKRTAKKDIDCFEVIASQESRVEGSSFLSIWKQAWEQYENGENTKIGFVISFPVHGGQTVTKTLLKPSDSKEFYEYLEIYLYDDIHQTPGVWYSHLEDKDMKEETVISSIKLTAGSKIDQVGDITLTAFLYNGEDCFDAAGEYLGEVAWSITVTQ